MPIMAWVAIGTFGAGTLWSVGVWLVGRRINRLDKLEDSVHGREGLIRQVDRLITRDEFNDRHVQIEDILQRLSEEGQSREERIREHIDAVRRTREEDMRDLRSELSEIHKRINAAVRLSSK
jgi:hypothetical protein